MLRVPPCLLTTILKVGNYFRLSIGGHFLQPRAQQLKEIFFEPQPDSYYVYFLTFFWGKIDRFFLLTDVTTSPHITRTGGILIILENTMNHIIIAHAMTLAAAVTAAILQSVKLHTKH